MTANELARLFGISPVTPRRWIREGYLAAVHAGPQKFYAITPTDVQAFIRQRDTWMLWTPARMTDSVLQLQAYWHRAVSGGRWYSTLDLAARYHYSQRTVCLWIAESRLPAIRRFQQAYVWSGDLAGFIPPVDARTAEDYAQSRRKAAVTRLANWARSAG